MEVILLEDVRTLGKKGQIVKINDSDFSVTIRVTHDGIL